MSLYMCFAEQCLPTIFAEMVLRRKFPYIDIPFSKTRLQFINENSHLYLKDLIPSEAFQGDDENDASMPQFSACILARDLTERDVKACLDLIESTSSADYKASSIGWSRAKKRKEMRLPDLKYVFLRKSRNGIPFGFMSFMLTFEDGVEVIYLYELHLSLEMQGQGVGMKMMAILERAGRIAEVKKSMLTVFKANTNALQFYEKLGYEEDDFSPKPRKLRNGILKEPDYVILSKEISKDYDYAEVRRLSKRAERILPSDSLMPPSKKRKAR